MKEQISTGAVAAWTAALTFLPKFVLFIAIMVIGYFVAKWIGRLVNAALERVGFDKLVERGGIKKALSKTEYDASDLMCKLAFYMIFLFVLQLAFGVFGPNPVSDILTRVIAFLPTVFVSLLIVVVTAAIAKAVKDILTAILGGLSYGKALAGFASGAVIVTGIFAALSHLGIAPAIVNGLFYTLLAIVAGSAIVAIGGGGIQPMRQQWDKALGRIQEEAPRVRSELEHAPERAQETARQWRDQARAAESPQPSPAGRNQ